MTDPPAVLSTLKNALAGYAALPGWVIALRPHRPAPQPSRSFHLISLFCIPSPFSKGWKVNPKLRLAGSLRQYGPGTRPHCSNMILT
jgi:hypothetical protein